jgi:hypothetical protein
MVQLSATRCSCIAILWASLVSFSAITLCVASQRVFIVVSVYFVITQSGNFWIHPLCRFLPYHSRPPSAEVKECVELYFHSPNTSSWCVAYLSKVRPLPLLFTFTLQHHTGSQTRRPGLKTINPPYCSCILHAQLPNHGLLTPQHRKCTYR